MADITSTLSAFDEWMKKRRMAQVAGMGTIESGDYGAKPYYTDTTGLGEAGPSMNPQEYSRLGSIMNPPVSAEPMESVLPPGPGTAAREEGISAIASGYQGVPAKQMQAASALAPEEFSRPDVYSGQMYVPGTETSPTNAEGYTRRWQMASALEGARKPWVTVGPNGEKKLQWAPPEVAKGALEQYSGEAGANVDRMLADAYRLRQAGDSEGASRLEKIAEANIKNVSAGLAPGLAKSEIGLRGAQSEQARATAGYMGRRGTEESKLEKSNQELMKKKAILLTQKNAKISDIIKTWGQPEVKTGFLGIGAGPNAVKQMIDAAEEQYKRDASMLEMFGGQFTPPGLAESAPDKSLWEQYNK